MIQPRNTLVLVRLHEQPARQVGKITVPTNADQFTEAEVIAVGPGNVSAQGGVSETFDLKIGQRVLVLYKDRDANRSLKNCGIPVRQDEETLYLYEQARIMGVIAQPGDVPASSILTN
jgi:co-chaperonin GroES (HSP10)